MDELENRVQEVKDLLSYFIKQRDFVKKIGEATEAWDRLISITTTELTTLTGIKSEKPYNIYTKYKSKSNILVVNIGFLPSEYKDLSLDSVKNKLEQLYEYPVFLIDSSRQNTQGLSTECLPVYLI